MRSTITVHIYRQENFQHLRLVICIREFPVIFLYFKLSCNIYKRKLLYCWEVRTRTFATELCNGSNSRNTWALRKLMHFGMDYTRNWNNLRFYKSRGSLVKLWNWKMLNNFLLMSDMSNRTSYKAIPHTVCNIFANDKVNFTYR